MYTIESLVIFEFGEPEWKEEYENKFVSHDNQDPDSPYYRIDKPGYWAEIHIGQDIDYYKVREDIASVRFRQESGLLNIKDAASFMVSYVNIPEIPVCKNMVPSYNHADPALDLYDYPFTLLGLKDNCISRELGNSPKKPHACAYSEISNYDACPAYQAFEEIVLGVVTDNGTKLVKLDRTTRENKYIYEGQTFATYKKFLEFVAEKKLDFELTYNPVTHDGTDFFSGVMTRLENTYALEAV